MILPAFSRTRRALLLSQAGPGAGRWLTSVPTSLGTTLKPLRMQIALRRRLRWPLPIGPRRCNGRFCRAELDRRGDHWAACMRSGRICLRARPLEKVWARVFREAGARVQEHVKLRDLAIPNISATDERALEVVATGLPLARGVPLGVDATMVSVLHDNGEPRARADVKPGVCLARAEERKATTYPEIVNSEVLQLTTLACEVGGRWSATCVDTIAQLASARAREAPRHLQLSTRLAFEARWWALLSCAQQDALAATLVDDRLLLLAGHDGQQPELVDVIVEALGHTA